MDRGNYFVNVIKQCTNEKKKQTLSYYTSILKLHAHGAADFIKTACSHLFLTILRNVMFVLPTWPVLNAPCLVL